MTQGERRKMSRIPVGDSLTVEIVGVRQPITLVNVGPGGFAVATDEWLPSTPRPEARFQTADRRWTATFEARMSFALLQPRKSGPFKGRYITGFAFRDARQPEVRKRVQELLEQITQIPA